MQTEIKNVTFSINPHVGSTLMDASKTYDSLTKGVVEMVQNGIDNDAMHISISIDKQKRTGQVTNDGDGASIADIEDAFNNLNNTRKSGKRRKSKKGRVRIGRHGKGLFALLASCRYFTFVSSPRGISQYMSYRFEHAKIEKMRHVEIIGEHVPGLVFREGSDIASEPSRNDDVHVVDWVTCVTFHDYTTDPTINDLTTAEDLIANVFDAFGSLMHKEGILLSVTFIDENGKKYEHLKVEAPQFTGVPLEENTQWLDDGSRTVFKMYLATKDSKGKPSGKVLIGDIIDPSTFSFKDFVGSIASYGLLPDDVRDGMLSGHFEGEIRSGSARMHKERKKFTMNQGVPKLCQMLTQWHEEVGHYHVDRIDGARKDERHQRLGRESLKSIEALLKQPALKHLNNVMKEFEEGTVGIGHTEPDPENVLGKQKDTSVSTTGFSGLKDALEKKAVLAKKKSKPKPKGPISGHNPMSVVGPLGSKRIIVDKSSLGIQIVYDYMEGREELWIFDAHRGILCFNICHPVWELCDGDGKTKVSDTRVRRLQETVVIIVLQWLSLPEEQRPMYLDMMEKHVQAQAFLYKSSSSFK